MSMGSKKPQPPPGDYKYNPDRPVSPPPPRKSRGSAMPAYWVLVWMPSGIPIVPYDLNPGSDDDGMLVYGSREAGDLAAKHQMKLWGADDEQAVAIPLSHVGLAITV